VQQQTVAVPVAVGGGGGHEGLEEWTAGLHNDGVGREMTVSLSPATAWLFLHGRCTVALD
jgi:hypothetical protein